MIVTVANAQDRGSALSALRNLPGVCEKVRAIWVARLCRPISRMGDHKIQVLPYRMLNRLAWAGCFQAAS